MNATLDQLREKVGKIIEQDRNDLVDLCLRLGAIESPCGKERLAAEAVVDWFSNSGIETWLQPIGNTSANGIGHLKGTGGGKSLIFDAHLDTGAPNLVGRTPIAKRMETGFVEGELICGHGIVNDKAQVAAFMIATRSLQKAGVKLKGDLYTAAVAFETGLGSVDEFQGIDRPGEGFGSKWLIDRGLITDYALIGETTGFGIVDVECGYVELKISILGRPLYTPRLVRSKTWQENSNPFEKAAHIAVALEQWAADYEQREKTEIPSGTLNPKAQILGIRGNGAGGLGGSDCNIYLDVWITPGKDPRLILKEVRQLIDSLGVGGVEVSMYQWARGYMAKNAEPLINSVKDAHSYVVGSPTTKPPSATISMWRDLNAFNEVGIPSICYGAPRQKETYTYEQNRAMKISDLVSATKVYAFTAMSICGVE